MKYLISDHLGSTVAITDNTGNVLAETRYMPFGEPRTNVGSLGGTDKTYTGQRDVLDTGLMDYRARMYSIWLGRFIQPDTIVPYTNNSQMWNRYTYVGNNSINRIDPSGHRCLPEDECDMPRGDNLNRRIPFQENKSNIKLTTHGKNVADLYLVYLSSPDGFWQKQIRKGADPFTLFLAIMLSRESLPLWIRGSGAGWGNGGTDDPKLFFSSAVNHWSSAWIKDVYGVDIGSAPTMTKMGGIFNWLGKMESVEGVVYASQGKLLKDGKLEPDSQYINLTPSERVTKVLPGNYYNPDLYTMSDYALNNTTSGYWTWGNHIPPPTDSIYSFGSYYILDHYE